MGWTLCVVWFLCLSVNECWQLPDSKHGVVQSPRYPQPYLPNLLKQWDLWVPVGYQIHMSITHLDIKASLDCQHDSLTVLFDQKVLGKFCGQQKLTTLPILSPGNKVTLVFQTSDSAPELQQHTGFSATYKGIDIDECSQPDPADGSSPLCSQICVNTPGSYHCSCRSGYKLNFDQRTCLLSCGGCIFDKHEGHLSSPGYPLVSPSLTPLTCKYIISVQPRSTITLNFTDNFHIESVDTKQGPRCLHHWLQVTIPGREPMKLCGRTSPGVIATNSSIVRLDYHTDSQGKSRGWSLDYRTHVIDCGEPKPLLNGGWTFLSGFPNEYRSVVQYYCNEPFYSFTEGVTFKFTCEADGKWRSIHRDVTPACKFVCGQPTEVISAYGRIFGGSKAPDNTIPWQVLLSIDGVRFGGMVIAERWIMTAANALHNAHETNKIKSVQIYIGHTDLKTLRFHVMPASIHIHPEYNNSNGINHNNDIALIKLQEPITFSASVMPICLPAEDAKYETGMMGLISGFGIIQRNGIITLPMQMNYVHLPVVENETCHNSINELKKTMSHIPSLTNNMFCAGLPEGGKDSCQGDSGGPLALMDDDGRFWAAGIVSWGVACGKPGTYGVYTKVANYLDWINKTMQEN